jgi:hypothetical protein
MSSHSVRSVGKPERNLGEPLPLVAGNEGISSEFTRDYSQVRASRYCHARGSRAQTVELRKVQFLPWSAPGSRPRSGRESGLRQIGREQRVVNSTVDSKSSCAVFGGGVGIAEIRVGN